MEDPECTILTLVNLGWMLLSSHNKTGHWWKSPAAFAFWPSLGNDAGPGMEVPGDSTSQGRDSVNVSGPAIPAVLYGNQYAVLFDTEPTELEDLDGLLV